MMSLLVALALSAAEPPTAPAPAAAPAPVAGATTVAEAAVTAPLTYGITIGKDVPKTGKVCFKDPILGSKIPTRRCMDRKAFEERQLQERSFIDSVQRDARAPVSN